MEKIKFFGKDYSKIDELDTDGKDTKSIALPDGSILTINEQIKKNIIIKLFDKCQPEKALVNYSGDKMKDDDLALYTISSYGCLYGGVVGVVRGKITMTWSEIITDSPVPLGINMEEMVDLDVTVQVQSRFDVGGKPFFLATMLMTEPELTPSSFSIPSDDNMFFDFLLLFRFKKSFEEAIQKGFFKKYQNFEKNDDRLKGRIDIARHIRLNMGLKNGKIAYCIREKSVDNYLNHLIVRAYLVMKKKHFDLVREYFDNDIDLKKEIDSLVAKIGTDIYSTGKLIAKNSFPVSHPYYTEYEGLRKVSLRILCNEGVSPFDGDKEDINSILFYIPDLWENYLYRSFVLNNLNEKRIDAQQKIKILEKKATIRPDYLFYIDDETDNKMKKYFFILDAKFKEKWKNTLSKSITNSNLEDYTKCIRDMNAVNAHGAGVIFPMNNTTELINYKQLSVSERNRTDCFYIFPVVVPHVKTEPNYNDWKRGLDKNIKNVITKQLASVLTTEKAYWDKIQTLSFPGR